MELIPQLQSFGLTADESAAYLALLELESAPVAAVASRAGLKRPTCYPVLEALERQGLAVRQPGGRGAPYKAVAPSEIVRQAAGRLEAARALAPLLASRMASDSLDPKVSFYEGSTGQRQLFGDILTHLKVQRNPEILWLGNWEALEARRPGELERSFAVHSKRKVAKREIVVDTPKARELLKKYAYPSFDYRFARTNQEVGVDFCVTGNRVALFSLEAPLFGLSIEHRAVAKSFKTLFELAWVGSTEK